MTTIADEMAELRAKMDTLIVEYVDHDGSRHCHIDPEWHEVRRRHQMLFELHEMSRPVPQTQSWGLAMFMGECC